MRAQSEQTGLGTLACGERIEFVVAHGAQKYGLGIERRSQRAGGQRCAVLFNGYAADAPIVQLERVAAGLRCLFENPDGLLDDFRADAVSGRNQNLQFHSFSPFRMMNLSSSFTTNIKTIQTNNHTRIASTRRMIASPWNQPPPCGGKA